MKMNETINLQYCRSNGSWADCDENDDSVERASRHNEITTDEVLAKLNAGGRVYYSTGWDDMIRNKPEPKTAKTLPVANRGLASDDGQAYDECER